MKIDLRILDPRINAEFGLPRYGTDGAAGLDLSACIDGPMTLQAGATELIICSADSTSIRPAPR